MQNRNSFCSGLLLLTATTGMVSHAMAEQIEHVEVVGQSTTSNSSIVLDNVQPQSPDLRDTLRRLPGMASNGNGPLTSIAQYRGLYGDRVQVNVDGAPVIGAGPNAMDPPLSNTFALPGTEIELYRGIAPVSAGMQTLGGAIKVSRNADALFDSTPAWHGALNLMHSEQGSADNFLGSFGYHSSDLYLQGFAATQQRDDVEDGNSNVIPNSYYDRNMFGLAAGARYGQHQWQGHYQRIDTDSTGTPALAMDIEFIDSEMYRLSYQWRDKNNGVLTVRANGNSNQHGMNNVDNRPMTMPMMARLNTVDSFARTYGVTWQAESDWGTYETGFDWHHDEHNSVITNPQMNNLTINNFNGIENTTSSFYGQWGDEISDMNILLGARYTQVDTDAGDVSSSMAMMNPNVGMLVEQFNSADRKLDFDYLDVALHLNGQLSKHLQWQVALGHKNRAPSYTELYVWLPLGISAGLADGRNYLGNLDLNEETARQLDLGIHYQSSDMSFSPRVFYQRIDDYIVGNPSSNMPANMISTMMSGRPPLQWQNTDATLYGMDVEFRLALANELTLEMVASMVRGERGDLEQALYRIAPASLITRLDWQKSQWTVSVESILVAEQTRVSEIQNEQSSAGYGVINAFASYQLNDTVSINAAVSNAFDKAYQSHLGGVNRVAGVAQPVGERLFAEGRTFSLALDVRF